MKTIIIIDDDPSLRRSLLRVAESAYYTAEGFAGGREFFDWLPSDQAACLVVDVRMDEMTGFEVQERVAVPVVFITGHDDPAARARLAHGAAPGAAEAVTAAVAACFGIRRPYPLMPMAPTLVRPPFHREGWGLLRRRSTVGECLLTRATAAFWLALVTPPNTGGARFRKLAGAIATVNADVVVLGGEAAVFDEKLLSRCHLLGDDVAPRFWDSGAFIVMSDPEAYMSCASRLSVSR